MPNLELRPKAHVSSFRRIAIGTWRTAGDPSVYGALTLRVDEAERYIAAFRRVTGRRLTLSHLMAKAVAAVFQKVPDANAVLRFNRIYLRSRISVFFQVALEDPKTGEIDLSGAVVRDADAKSLVEIVDDLDRTVGSVRSGEDESLEKARSGFKKVPFLLLNTLVKILGFLGWTLNMDLRGMGLAQDPFGSVMITNIGSLGLEEAYVPLVPYSRVPLLVALGAIRDEAVVEDGKLVPGRVMRVNATFDHRVLDGAHAAVMAKTLKAWFDAPFEHFDRLEQVVPAEAEAEEVVVAG